LITVSQSAHIYDDCWDNADSLIKNHHFGGTNEMAYDDPAGDFLVTVESDRVRVTQTFPTGTECQSWEGRNATRLMRQIALAVPHIQTGHALYLGGEIDRACRCLKAGVEFVQDRP
jgi:thymidylate synthase